MRDFTRFLLVGAMLVTAWGCGGGDDGPGNDCDKACAKLSSCGVLQDQTKCATDCKAQSSFQTCIHGVVDDCNGLSQCVFKQVCLGAPMGRSSCRAAAGCIARCSYGDASCACGCSADLTPNHSINLLINNACAVFRCPMACGPGSSALVCGGCFSQQCTQQAEQCNSAP